MARASGVAQGPLVAETVHALRGFASDQMGLVTACRRVVGRHLSCGAVVTVAARTLTASDPIDSLIAAGREAADDPTARTLADSLPVGALMVVVGWPEVAVAALGRRGDVCVMVVDTTGEGEDLVDALERADVPAELVGPEGVGAAVRCAASAGEDAVVVIEADVVGPQSAIAVPGSLAAAATARALGVGVVLSVPFGRCHPASMFDAALERLETAVERPWEAAWDLVPVSLVDEVVRGGRRGPVADLLSEPDCPVAPELFSAAAF